MKKIIYIFAIGSDLKFKSNYNLELNEEKNKTVIYSIIGRKISNLLRISEKNLTSFLKDLGTHFEYSSGRYRQVFKNGKKPNLIKVDFIELYKLHKILNDKGEKETASFIKETFEKDKDFFLLDILSNLQKSTTYYYDDIADFKLELDEYKPNEENRNLVNKLFELFGVIDYVDDFINLYKNYLKDFHEEKKFILENISINESKIIEKFSLNIFSDLKKYYNKNFNLELELNNTEKIKIENIYGTLNNDKNNDDIKHNYQILNKLLEYKNNNFTIIGSEGSGKGLIALSLILEANENKYLKNVFTFNKNTNKENINKYLLIIDEMLKIENKSIFIIFHGLHNINNNDFKIFIPKIKYILEKNSQNIIIFTSEDNRENSQSVLNDSFFKDSLILKIRIFSKNLPNFVDNLEFTSLYFKFKDNNITSKSDLCYKYIENSLNKVSFKNDYSKEELFDDLKKYAYKIFTGKKVIVSTEKIEFRNSIKKLKNIISVDIDNLKFNSEIIFDYLVSNYILSLDYNEINNIIENISLKLENRLILIFLAENIIYKEDLIINCPKLLSLIINNLRQIKDIDNINKIIQEIKVNNLSDSNLLLEISKYYYQKYDYPNSIEFSIRAVNNSITNENKSKIFNQISSCLLDLYVLDASLCFAELAEKISDKHNKPRIIGNKARIFLKKNEYSKSEELFIYKLDFHIKLNKIIDILRDKTDLILFYSISGKKIDEIKKLFDQIIEEYNKLSLSQEIDYSNNLVYAYRNYSYLLNKLNYKDGEELIENTLNFTDNFDSKFILNKIPVIHYYINLSKFYDLNNKSNCLIKFLEKAKNLLEDDMFIESYFVYSYLFLIKNEEYYREKSEHYYSLINYNRNKTIDLINNNFNLNFKIEKYINLTENKTNLHKIIIF